MSRAATLALISVLTTGLCLPVKAQGLTPYEVEQLQMDLDANQAKVDELNRETGDTQEQINELQDELDQDYQDSQTWDGGDN